MSLISLTIGSIAGSGPLLTPYGLFLSNRWHHAHQAGMNPARLELVRSTWKEGSDDKPGFLEEPNRDFYRLTDTYRRIRAFLVHQGQHREEESRRSKRAGPGKGRGKGRAKRETK